MPATPPTRFTPSEPFLPAPGIQGPHAQTVLGVVVRPLRGPPLTRERWETPDGDFVDVDFLQAPPDVPWVLALHGLEGSSQSGYILNILRGAAARGWGALVLNFRSCSGEPNRLLRSYHSGELLDPQLVLERLRARLRGPLFGVGFSLGANVMARLLGELGEKAPFKAAAAVSVPFDLVECARTLDDTPGWTRLYRVNFIRTLKRKALGKARAHPGTLDPRSIRAVRRLQEFDDVVTGPVHGFTGARDYYVRCSSGPVLGHIRVPTLLLNAQDDPMIPAHSIPQNDNPWLSWAITERGGHVGFIAGSLARPRFWAEEQVMRFFDRHA